MQFNVFSPVGRFVTANDVFGMFSDINAVGNSSQTAETVRWAPTNQLIQSSNIKRKYYNTEADSIELRNLLESWSLGGLFKFCEGLFKIKYSSFFKPFLL